MNAGPRRRIQNHRDLLVWRKAMDLLVECHRLGRRLPHEERYGLRAQLTRAALSVPANIAEGNGRLRPREYIHFLSIARGSVSELDTHLEALARLGLADLNQLAPARRLTEECSRMLLALMRALERHLRLAREHRSTGA